MFKILNLDGNYHKTYLKIKKEEFEEFNNALNSLSIILKLEDKYSINFYSSKDGFSNKHDIEDDHSLNNLPYSIMFIERNKDKDTHMQGWFYLIKFYFILNEDLSLMDIVIDDWQENFISKDKVYDFNSLMCSNAEKINKIIELL